MKVRHCINYMHKLQKIEPHCLQTMNVIKFLISLSISEVRKNTDTPVVYYVVGNKTDLIDGRMVMYEEAEEFANSVNAHYWETSVYSNIGNI